MNEAILIQSDDWEGLFINGKLVEEAHTLNKGYDRVRYFLKLSKKYNFDIENLKETCVTESYQVILENTGGFHINVEDVGYECVE